MHVELEKLPPVLENILSLVKLKKKKKKKVKDEGKAVEREEC